MSLPDDRILHLTLRVQANHPELLAGFEDWLQRGLITDDQIEGWCQTYLSSLLPLSVPVPGSTTVPESLAPLKNTLDQDDRGDFSETFSGTFPGEDQDDRDEYEEYEEEYKYRKQYEDDFEAFESTQSVSVPVGAATELKTKLKTGSKMQAAVIPVPPALSRSLQGLVEEISLRWLLFLGVFLVIVSSGVLAASQWDRFNSWGQYLVLLTYTTVFFLVARLCNQRPQLRLTTSTLQGVSLLLVPVNFWAMDGLQVWQSWIGGVVMLVALLLLGSLVRSLLASLDRSSTVLLLQKRSFWGFLVLALFQWGWAIPHWPLIAVYGGVLVTQVPRQKVEKNWLLWYSVGILVLRAVFVAGIALPQLGVAIALAGYFLKGQPLIEIIGATLLGLGWCVTVGSLPLQTIVISGLGLVFWGQRLQRDWKRLDWFILVTIALQVCWPIWRLVPEEIQAGLVQWGTEFTATSFYPEGLLFLALSPFLIELVLCSQWFQVHRKASLAQMSDGLAVVLGSVLLTGSLVAIPLRTLVLLMSTIACGLRLFRPVTASKESGSDPSLRNATDLTHSLSILTFFSGIQWFEPSWSFFQWVLVVLGASLFHWSFSLTQGVPGTRYGYWQRSSLLWAIVLTIATYLMLFSGLFLEYLRPWQTLCWSLIPFTFTLIAYCRSKPDDRPQRKAFIIASTIAVLLFQGLTIGFPATRQWGFLLGGVTVLLNSWCMPQVLLAGLTIGLGFFSSSFALSEGLLGFPAIEGLEWFIYWAVMLNILWGIDRLTPVFFQSSHSDRSQVTLFAQAYQRACAAWGFLIAILFGILLTMTAVIVSQSLDNPGSDILIPLEWMVATGLFTLAIVQSSYPWRSNRSLYALTWGLELLLVHGLGYAQNRIPALQSFSYELVLTHLALAIVSQQLGDWWRSRNPSKQTPSSVQVIPVLWVLLTHLSRVGVAIPWTGWISGGMAWVLLQVGRRNRNWQPLVYLSLVGFTGAGMQILAYPLRENSTVLLLAWSGFTAIVAVIYRFVSVGQQSSESPIRTQTRSQTQSQTQTRTHGLATYLTLPLSQLRQGGHLHWGFSTGLLLLTIVSTQGSWAAVNSVIFLTSLVLMGYALAQARHQSTLTASIWSYGSVVNLASGLYYAWTIAPDAWHLWANQWSLTIVSPLGLLLYLLPWARNGWTARPWQQLGVGLPLLITIVTLNTATAGSWFVTAISYALLSYRTQQLRFSYLSVLFLDATAWLWCVEHDRTTWLWYSLPLALSLLWITIVDPQLQQPHRRDIRHNLRMVAAALLCGVPLLPGQANSWVILGLSLLTIFAGLGLKIRAFLFVGTIAFLSHSFYQLVILVAQQSLLKWAIGLGVGIILIWIAATFETRREQIRTLLYSWTEALAHWE